MAYWKPISGSRMERTETELNTEESMIQEQKNNGAVKMVVADGTTAGAVSPQNQKSLATTTPSPEGDALQRIASALMVDGDLSKLGPAQKAKYLMMLCDRYGLDFASKPFQIIKTQGKEIPYLTRGGAEQLGRNARVSISVEHIGVQKIGEFEVYLVKSTARTPDGVSIDSEGAVAMNTVRTAEDAANLPMKAATKARRRAIVAIAGLGMPTEDELDTIKHEKVRTVTTAELLDEEKKQ